MIDEAALDRMKRTGYLVNVSRGKIVREGALVDAIKQGKIAGAGLDVTEQELLPPESPLWDLEGVIITPHLSGLGEGVSRRIMEICCDNLRRYRQGQVLMNVVDKSLGY